MKKYNRNCNTCGKTYTGYGKLYCSTQCQPRKKHTAESKEKMSIPRGGGYFAIHVWLKSNYGKADHCESENCPGSCEKFEWALKKGKKHSHNKSYYLQLCKSCHMKYDEVHCGEKHYNWKGGKPDCSNCGKQLSVWKSQSKTGLCGTCNRKLNPPWKGKSRKAYNLTNKNA